MIKKIFITVFVNIFIHSAYASGPGKRFEVGIDEQLGAYLPLDTKFVDEYGKKYSLKELFTKPTVLAFVYYECPGICSPLMMELADIINKSDLVPGVDYNVVTISMDEFETPEQALERKEVFIKTLDKNIPPESWKFLTGDSASIRAVAIRQVFISKGKGRTFVTLELSYLLIKKGKYADIFSQVFLKEVVSAFFRSTLKWQYLKQVKVKPHQLSQKFYSFAFHTNQKAELMFLI